MNLIQKKNTPLELRRYQRNLLVGMGALTLFLGLFVIFGWWSESMIIVTIFPEFPSLNLF